MPFGHRPYVQKEQVFSQYKDYLRFCSDLEYDTKSDFILYPRNIKDAYDRASEMMDKRKMRSTTKNLRRLCGIGRAIWPEKVWTCHDGSEDCRGNRKKKDMSLRHCVGGYISRVANSGVCHSVSEAV